MKAASSQEIALPGAVRKVLRCGELAFTAYEMGQGPLVILLHGFPDTPRTWRLQMPALKAAGYRVVAVTLRGYEPSSLPSNGSYHVSSLAQDVVDWIDALGAPSAHLVAHDWGASIAYAAAALAPSRVVSLTTLAVPHPAAFAVAAKADASQMKRLRYIMLFQLPGFAEWYVRRKSFAYLETLWRNWSPGWKYAEGDLQATKDQFADPNVLGAALRYYRQALDTRSENGKASAALYAKPVDVPTMGLYGTLDGCIWPSVFEKSMPEHTFTKGRELVKIESAGHFLHQEKAEQINNLIIEFLKRH